MPKYPTANWLIFLTPHSPILDDAAHSVAPVLCIVMKGSAWIFTLWLVLIINTSWGVTSTQQGFSFQSGRNEVTMRYKKFNELIVLSTTLNDTLPVNLILDTGFRNIILFGKKYNRFLKSVLPKDISFSGLGADAPCTAKVSLGNAITLNGIAGTGITIVVAQKRNILTGAGWIDGIIGYDLLYKFEIEINPAKSTITFRPALQTTPRADFELFRLLPNSVVPMIEASVEYDDASRTFPMLIDTGSQLALLLKSQHTPHGTGARVARGVCGPITAESHYTKWFALGSKIIMTELNYLATHTQSEDSMSMGMGLLKDHTFILNLTQGFFALQHKNREPFRFSNTIVSK